MLYTYWRSLLYTWHLYCFFYQIFYIYCYLTYLINILINLFVIFLIFLCWSHNCFDCIICIVLFIFFYCILCIYMDDVLSEINFNNNNRRAFSVFASVLSSNTICIENCKKRHVFDIWSVFETYLQMQSNTHKNYQQ